MNATAENDISAELDAEIRDILGRATDRLSVSEILAKSRLADGRHTIAAALHRLVDRDEVTRHNHYGACTYWLRGNDGRYPTTIRGRVEAYLRRASAPRSLRQIADDLQIERRVAGRALNHLAKHGRAERVPLTAYGRDAWRLATPLVAAPPVPAANESATPVVPVANAAVFALASDGTLTLCTPDTELALDAEETTALLDYLQPFMSQRSPA